MQNGVFGRVCAPFNLQPLKRILIIENPKNANYTGKRPQTVRVVGSQHDSSIDFIVCLLWWSSIVSICFKCFLFQIPCLLSFSFPLVVLSYLFISILLDFSKCLMSQNIGGLIKARFKKTAPKHFFKGVAHEQPDLQ